MFDPLVFYAGSLLLAAVLAVFGMIRPFRFKNALIVFAFSANLAVLGGSIVSMLSHPMPVSYMLVRPDVEKAKIMGMDSREGEYIMLLLLWDGLGYPRWFRFPWDQQMMEEIQKEMENAREGETQGFELISPFEPSLDDRDRQWTHPIPIPDQMQPKPDSEPEVFEFYRDT